MKNDPDQLRKLPIDAIAVAVATLLALAVFVFFFWQRLLYLFGAAIVIALVGSAVFIPNIWICERLLRWSSARQTPTQRVAYPIIVSAIVVVAIVIIFAAILSVGGSVS